MLRRGFWNLELFETESQLCTRASSRNAAIYRPLEADPALTELAWRNLALLTELEGDAPRQLLKKTGILFLDERRRRIQAHLELARRFSIPAEWIESPKERWPRLLGSLPGWYRGLFCSDGGVLDIHEMSEALRRKLVSSGVKITLNEEVRLYCHRGASRTSVLGVRKASGTTEKASRVVLAAGAGVGACLHEAGLSAPLLPLQRHLALIGPGEAADVPQPVVWQNQPEIYFRRETGGVLVSPCDESPCPSGIAQRELSALIPIPIRLSRIDQRLSQGSLRHFWACTRTKSLDGHPFIGPDHRILGLYWLAGLGGLGMSTGLAAGELLARLMETGACQPGFCPQRFESSVAGRLPPWRGVRDLTLDG